MAFDSLFPMKGYLLVLILINIVSCTPVYYLSVPVQYIPEIGLKTKRILVANKAIAWMEDEYYEKCIKGVKLTIQLKSDIKVYDDEFVMNFYDKEILLKAKKQYNVDGLLFLTKLNYRYSFHDIFTGKYGTPTGKSHRNNTVPIFRSDMLVKVTSSWEYHNLESGKTYKFKIANDKFQRLDYFVNNGGTFLQDSCKLLNPLFVQNGIETSNHLLGLSK